VSQPFRTHVGGRIDRSQPIRFSFDGDSFNGFRGDTLASALLANGRHLVGRSFKYHRPRGILSAGSEEPNALVRLNRGQGTPNMRATQLELYDGLAVSSQNCWPSLRADFNAIAGVLSPLLPAGFYYKTFMWPAPYWKRIYEPLIRRAAGLGEVPAGPDPDWYLHHYAFCDVLVIGGGPAGVGAALAAADAGARVILCDEQSEIGGSLLSASAVMIEGQDSAAWIRSALASLSAYNRVTLLTRTTAFGWFPDNMIALVERVTDHLAAPPAHLPRERLWHVRATEVVIAAGMIERPLVFPNNDRPGIMLAGAVRTYLNRYGVKAGTRVVVAAADDSAYGAALDLAAGGVKVMAIADLRLGGSKWSPAARSAGIEVMPGTTIATTTGRHRVTGVKIAKAAAPGTRVSTVPCDLVLMSGGFAPSVHLFSQSRGKLRFDAASRAFLPGISSARERSAGGCRGIVGIEACLNDGYEAGAAAAKAAGLKPAAAPRFAVAGSDSTQQVGLADQQVATEDATSGKAFVDFQYDVTAADVRLATREGYRSVEHIKRYTTAGMAPDQGKTSNLNTLAIASQALARDISQLGLTTFRMPFTPVTFGSLAGVARGELFDPVRTTPTHDWAAARGAVFEDVGTWKRARYFPVSTESMEAAVARECRAVREHVGLVDASTLSKIEVVGPDAAEFLNRIYTVRIDNLAPGRCRYGLMLNEAGYVMDDGIVGCLAPDRFHLTTTTGGAANVLEHLEDYLQTEWSMLKAWLTSITEQWATIAVQGPKARELIAPLVDGIDMSPQAMPHMTVQVGKVCGVPARLFRVSFTGELGYEINVPADYGQAVWEAVYEAGGRYGITPYGTETMHVLRAEKGYFIVRQETDGTVTPADLGLAWAVAKSKRDFVGKRSLTLPALAATGRKQLVGLLTDNADDVLEEGAQVVDDPNTPIPMPMIGHVTSSYRSAALERSIALALIKDGRARMGAKVHVPMPGRLISATVTEPVFIDPTGSRVHD
jgi:sarcosine oxidase subunit alpha